MPLLAPAQVTAQGESEILVTRDFAAPIQLVWDAWTKPELMQRWLGVRGGWTFPVCEMDLRVGGKYRWVWRKESKGLQMSAGGVFLEIDPPNRFVCTEKFDDPWYEGEALSTTTFVAIEGGTRMELVMKLPNSATRDGVLQSGMERGLEESYVAADTLLSNHV